MNKFSKLSPMTEASFYILLTLQEPRHGYGIIKKVDELTDGRLSLAAGTLYGVLQNLTSHKLIKLYRYEKENKKKKEYMITDLGRELLSYEIDRLKQMIKDSQSMEG